MADFFSKQTGLWTSTEFDDPKHETYMLRRVSDVDLAIARCKKTVVAVQAGGYIGFWPLRLIKSFSVVHTFEPLESNYKCLLKNVGNTPGIVAYNQLLGETDGEEVTFAVRKGWGSRVSEHDPNSEHYERRKVTTIDALQLPVCDAIFLDVEGYELKAILGATDTIARLRPVITLEGWDTNIGAYTAFMNEMKYKMVHRVHMDCIYVPEERIK